MLGLLLDALWAVFCLALGVGSVRVVGIALNARGRRRHARCLRNIERLEIANGFREASPTWQDILRKNTQASLFGPEVIEVKPGAPWPTFVPLSSQSNPFVQLAQLQQAAAPSYLDLFLEMRGGRVEHDADPGHRRG